MKNYLPLFTSSIRLISFVVILPFLNINESIAANIFWTGATDTDWNTASNWNPAQVPTSSDDVTIPNVTNDPTISANDAVANYVNITAGVVLTITSAGVLTIEGTHYRAILLYGTLENDGTINIGQTAGTFTFGIEFFEGTINNNATGKINIDRSSSMGIRCQSTNCTTNNFGTITIGANAASSMAYGMYIQGAFDNKSGANINIDRSTTRGLYLLSASPATNSGTITCGANGGGLGSAISTGGSNFTNNASGALHIDGCSSEGLYVPSGSTMTNNGTVNVGLVSSPGSAGILVYGTLNHMNGTINVDRATFRGIGFSGGNFNNSAEVIFGTASVPTWLIHTFGTFNNNSGGSVAGSGAIHSSGFTNNSGILKPGNSPGILTFSSGPEDFTSSTIEIEINGTGTAGTDFDQIVCTSVATLSSSSTILNVTTNYSPVDGDQVVILDATSLTGTFSASSSLGNWTIGYNSPSAGDVTLTYVVPPIESTQTGDWSDGSTWVGGVAPVAGGEVIIKSGHEITINGTTANCAIVTIESGGTLDNRGTLNNTGLVTVDVGGALTSFNSATYGAGGLQINGSYDGTTQGGNFFLTCNGDVTLGTTGTVDSDVEFQGVGGTFTNNGTITDMVVSGFTFINSSTGHIDLSGGDGFEIKESNFTNNAGGMITTGGAFLYNANNVASVSFINNGTVNIGSGTSFTLLRTVGVSLDLSNFDPIAGTLNLNLPIASNSFTFTGSVTNNGAINCVGCGTATPLIFGGSALLTIDGTGTIEASNAQFGGQVNIDNSNNIELAGSQSMESEFLNFVNGKLILSGSGDITTNTVSGFDASKYVVTSGVGRYKHYIHFNTLETLPVGPSTSGYNPLTIRPTNTFSEFSVNVSNGLNNTVGPDYVNIEWDITPTNSPTADLTFQWNSSGDETGAFDPNSCAVGHYNGASWDIISPSAAATCGSGVCSRTATGVSSFSPFGVAELNSLPVELMDFQTKLQENQTVLLDWQTASEFNNEGFAIERMTEDRLNWEEIGFVFGQGNTFDGQSYSYIDVRPREGVNYYRLKQIDHDGKFAYSEVKSVNMQGSAGKTVQVYPNPVGDGVLHLIANTTGEEMIQVSLFSLNGQLLLRKDFGSREFQLETNALEKGVYLLEVVDGHAVVRERIIKQ